MDWMDGLLFPLMVVVAWIMVRFHELFTWIGLDPTSGAAWGLSIVGLVIVMRILLIPLFFKQIKASRGMQLVQPEMQALQKKYKGKSDPASREAMSREMMELYKKHGTNPFASCLPILLQSPIFFALFRVLFELPRLAAGTYDRADAIGPMTRELAAQAEAATIWGAPLSGTFLKADGNVHIQIVTVILIVAMSVTTFTTQRQLTMKNMPPAALQGPMAQQQKILLYMLPLIFAFSGVNFPIGVLLYWTTTNVWSMGQQFYTIRRMPAPGSEAEKAYKARQARKAAARGQLVEETGTTAVIEEKPRGQRQQPKRKDRNKPRPTGSEPLAASAPVEDAPVVDAPVVDAPVADAPVADAVTDAPTTTTGPAARAKKKRKGTSSTPTDGPAAP
ncbi:membrane protein insertase YidC [Cellulomonas dongxiuzhuiae]|uniref:Membrane protein insertase YidC n=1 Tax=Cellulomonas dongxiuzhuiae TaxID=2819979 RepID=A0ABX8GKC0_9CELL|nr:membrane protein insertase YidC [Cellulomonas dongxiuzhuiae]MBO3095102.1 membrane protein insertase YidC [Cellulomonas dongxiuzhuiae]QWC16111.1 membrane protein insertase YidC [Cellulomonas dongxiuzhuiae]